LKILAGLFGVSWCKSKSLGIMEWC